MLVQWRLLTLAYRNSSEASNETTTAESLEDTLNRQRLSQRRGPWAIPLGQVSVRLAQPTRSFRHVFYPTSSERWRITIRSTSTHICCRRFTPSHSRIRKNSNPTYCLGSTLGCGNQGFNGARDFFSNRSQVEMMSSTLSTQRPGGRT